MAKIKNFVWFVKCIEEDPENFADCVSNLGLALDAFHRDVGLLSLKRVKIVL